MVNRLFPTVGQKSAAVLTTGSSPQSSEHAVEIPPFKNNDSHLLSILYLRRTCSGAVSSSKQI